MNPCEHGATGMSGLSGLAVVQALADAEARCKMLGQRFTSPRRRVLELLLGARGPVKAYDLISAFGADADGRPAKPPTVYRALDFLERHHFAHRIVTLNAFVACQRGAELHAAAFLICDCCGTAREIEPEGAGDLVASAERTGHAVKALTIEAHGLCAGCRTV